MMGCHQALLLITPLEEREVNNPKTLEHVLVTQAQTITHLKTERAKLDTSLIGIVAAQNQNEVAIVSTHYSLDFCKLLWRVELIDATLHSTICIILDIYQTLGTYLWTLYEVGQLVQLLTAIVSTTRNTDTTNIFSLIEYRKVTLASESILQLYKLHAEAKVWLIATETAHSLMPCHLLQLRKLYTTNLLEEMASHFLEKIDNIVLIYEAHLAVDLSKLRLAVCTEVLITEALGNLEVAVETCYHQELLQSLRALWKSIELTRIHTRRNYEVASTFWCTTDEDRSFNLHEVL